MENTTHTERDFGMLWSIACIVLAIGISCGLVEFIDEETFVNYKIESALQDLEQKYFPAEKNIAPTRPVASVDDPFPTDYIHSMVLQ